MPTARGLACAWAQGWAEAGAAPSDAAPASARPAAAIAASETSDAMHPCRHYVGTCRSSFSGFQQFGGRRR